MVKRKDKKNTGTSFNKDKAKGLKDFKQSFLEDVDITRDYSLEPAREKLDSKYPNRKRIMLKVENRRVAAVSDAFR